MTYTGRDVRRLEDADLLRGAGRFADDLPVRWDGHCQLKRPWYARCVGGAAARVGELLCSPIMLPRSSRAGPEEAVLDPLS